MKLRGLTPVVSSVKSAYWEVRSISRHGKTGYIVESVEVTDALKKIDRIDRRKCRRRVEANFRTELMVNRYEKEFLKLFSYI